jgi:hypothetical protein
VGNHTQSIRALPKTHTPYFVYDDWKLFANTATVGPVISDVRKQNMISLSKSIRKRILDLCAVMAFLSWIAFLYMRHYFYAGVAPRQYDATTGHIFEVNNHGTVFYLNATQDNWTYFPLVFVAVFLLTLVFLESRWKIYKEISESRLKP